MISAVWVLSILNFIQEIFKVPIIPEATGINHAASPWLTGHELVRCVVITWVNGTKWPSAHSTRPYTLKGTSCVGGVGAQCHNELELRKTGWFLVKSEGLSRVRRTSLSLYLPSQTHTGKCRRTWSFLLFTKYSGLRQEMSQVYISACFHTSLWIQDFSPKEPGNTVFSHQFWMGILLTPIGNCKSILPRS